MSNETTTTTTAAATTIGPESVQPQLVTESTRLIPTAAMAHLKLVNHLKSYPVITQTRDLVLQVPLGRCTMETMESMSSPLKLASDTQPIKILWENCDTAVDSVLNTLDKSFPSLQKIEIHDFTDPITRPINGASETVSSGVKQANKQISEHILIPTTKAALNIKDKFNSLAYNSHGKGVISSIPDPLLAPINERLEQYVANYFPGTKKVSKQHSSELSRSMRIIKNVVTRQQALIIPQEISENETGGPQAVGAEVPVDGS